MAFLVKRGERPWVIDDLLSVTVSMGVNNHTNFSSILAFVQ
jgi:hypothetical protein